MSVVSEMVSGVNRYTKEHPGLDATVLAGVVAFLALATLASTNPWMAVPVLALAALPAYGAMAFVRAEPRGVQQALGLIGASLGRVLIIVGMVALAFGAYCLAIWGWEFIKWLGAEVRETFTS
ncbi:MAG: hypothetical protein ACKVT1_08530 [Dehalococcoidia bacterium]